jgi:serine/threonine protein kinase
LAKVAKFATGTALLKTGTTIGSPEYVAPEQARGKAVFASNLYSLGVTCVHMLTQLSPFDLFDIGEDASTSTAHNSPPAP